MLALISEVQPYIFTFFYLVGFLMTKICAILCAHIG